MIDTLKAYIDLTRAHFFLAWPILFCSGLVLAFENYGGFSWGLVLKTVLISLFGFEAGLVLNDYVDRDLDKKALKPGDRFNRYWRLFSRRPLAEGLISPKSAFSLFLLLVAGTSVLVLTLPFPNSLYVFAIMLYSFGIEYFYQVKKRAQKYPIAQLLGRTDLALFPVAGYLCYGQPDMTAFAYLVFFYPWTMAHLAVNDLIDVKNDRIRGLRTIMVLYGMKGTLYWIVGFTLLHFLVSPLFLRELGNIAFYGFMLGFLLLAAANLYLLNEKSSEAGLKALPVFHGTMVIYAVSIILDFIY